MTIPSLSLCVCVCIYMYATEDINLCPLRLQWPLWPLKRQESSIYFFWIRYRSKWGGVMRMTWSDWGECALQGTWFFFLFFFFVLSIVIKPSRRRAHVEVQGRYLQSNIIWSSMCILLSFPLLQESESRLCIFSFEHPSERSLVNSSIIGMSDVNVYGGHRVITHGIQIKAYCMHNEGWYKAEDHTRK